MKKILLTVIGLLAMVSMAWAGFNVQFEWTPNTEPDLAGYNMYRATTDGGPYTKIGSSTSAQYTDGSVEFGITYYWVVTAFDTDGNESGYSNQVSNMTEAPEPPDTDAPGSPQNVNVTVHITVN